MGMFTTSAPVAKFRKVGDTVSGEITDVYRCQRYEYVRGGAGQPLYWLNNKPVAGARIDPATGRKNDPVLQTVITVDTGIADEDGDTERRIFIKNKRMEDALKKAVTAAGGRRIGGLLLGGHLACTFAGEDETSDASVLPKVYEFVYTPPEPGKGREPSGDVRLADRDDSEDEPVRATGNAARYQEDPWAGVKAEPKAPARDQHQAALRDTVERKRSLAASVTGQADDEPPF